MRIGGFDENNYLQENMSCRVRIQNHSNKLPDMIITYNIPKKTIFTLNYFGKQHFTRLHFFQPLTKPIAKPIDILAVSGIPRLDKAKAAV
jgi:hypothetical protein